ncbi:MAG: ABC transporter permease [Eubacterium sp.]|nr:ABC transporter permease [Eubacterium sp.]
MSNVKNRKCIENICRKSMSANKRRNVILAIAIALTTVMLTTLFTIGGSIMKSVEESTMYQVGTSDHAGFKFLTQEQFDLLSQDSAVHDLSYNIIVGDILNEELYEEYTEAHYTTEACAKSGYSMPEVGSLPEKENEIATCTTVLDAFGLPHEIGQTIHLILNNGFSEYEGDFVVSGYWEKPTATLANQIYVSKDFQEKFSPAWKNGEEKAKFVEINSFAGSINTSFNFRSSYNISGQMDELKSRLGWGKEVNEGVNWAYASSSVDPTSVAIVLILLALIFASGYLIIYNIFYIAVSADIRYYGLLKSIGTTNRQLKKIIVRQAAVLSVIAIPAGMILGYITSVIVLPVISNSFLRVPCEISPSILVFAASAVFSWLVVRISCIKPCKVIKKISPVEAVRYSDYTGINLSGKKKTRKVTPVSMAWENLKRSRSKTAVVILSLALSIIMINVTVSIVSSFDSNRYVKMYADSDFTVSEGSMISKNYQFITYEGVSEQDIEALGKIDGVTESGSVYMSDRFQLLEGTAYDRAKKLYEDHTDWFVYEEAQKAEYDESIYDRHEVNSHIYGVDKMVFDKIEIDDGDLDWEKFSTGKYVIASAPLESGNGKDDASYAFYQIGETVKIQFPNGSEEEYEVMAIGDISFAMGPDHSHNLDVNFSIPTQEYLKQVPESQGAMKYFFNVEETKMESVEEAVSEYCDVTNPNLGHTSRITFLNDFKQMTDTFVLVGGVLSFILALIGILNFINLTITSINERQKELGIIRAIGMTQKQMNQMLVGEGALRICLTFAFVLTVGLLLNYVIVNLIAGQMVMFSYKFVIWPILVCIPVFLAISIAVPRLVISSRKMSGLK